jgi:hypothetical protein
MPFSPSDWKFHFSEYEKRESREGRVFGYTQKIFIILQVTPFYDFIFQILFDFLYFSSFHVEDI